MKLRMLLSTLATLGTKPEAKPARPLDLKTRCPWDDRYAEARQRAEIFREVSRVVREGEALAAKRETVQG